MTRPFAMLFRQLFDSVSCTYTYLLADTVQRSAILIDPVLDKVERDVNLIKDLNLKLLYAANTHVHADHITGTGEIKARLPECKSLISKASAAKADKFVEPWDIVKIGQIELEVRPTPGHTNGDAEKLYESVHREIFSLPKDYLLYPAHDYKGCTVTTVDEEMRLNPRLTESKSEFVQIMKNLNLAYPKMIDTAVPANLVCGYVDL